MHLAIKVCRFITRLLFLLLRFPVNNHKQIEEKIVPLAVPKEDLDQYVATSSNRRLYVLLPVTVYLLYSIKSSFGGLYMLMLYDLTDPESNIKQLGVNLYEFTCLQTNCTQLSFNSTLAEDLVKLPVFALCNPKLSAYYHVGKFCGAFGILVFSMSGFGILIVGCMLPIQQFVASTSNNSLMYIVAPSVDRVSMSDRLSHILVDMTNSYLNFRRLTLRRAFGHCKACALKYLNNDLSTTHENGQLVCTNFSRHFRTTTQHSRASTADSEKIVHNTMERYLDGSFFWMTNELEIDAFVEDTLTIIRSDWWQVFLAKLFIKSAIATASLFFFFATVIILTLTSKSQETGEILMKFAQQMEKAKCSIWYTHKQNSGLDYLSTFDGKIINLSLIDVSWDKYNRFDISFFHFCPVVMITFAIIAFHMSISELACWTAELRFQLELAIEFSRFQLNLNKGEEEIRATRRLQNDYKRLKFGQPERKGQKFNMSLIKQVFKSQTGSRLLFIHTEPIKSKYYAASSQRISNCLSESTGLSTKIAHQELALSLMMDNSHEAKQWQGFESFLEMNQKLYMNFRLFTESIGCFSRPVATMIIHDQTLTYGFAVIAWWFRKKLPEITTESMVALVSSLIISFYGISAASNFHAKVSKVRRLVFSLFFHIFQNGCSACAQLV